MTEIAELYSADAAELYDHLQLDGNSETPITNDLIFYYLKESGARRVLDMSCGTGAQCIPLRRAGFDVVATDISDAMLQVAKRKASAARLNIDFRIADMRDVDAGPVDGIVSMFNAIGHLDTDGFIRTIRNASNHLPEGGVYIFDIFDRDLMQMVPPYELIDIAREIGDDKHVRFTKIEFDAVGGKVTLKHRIFLQRQMAAPKMTHEEFTLQTYTRDELEALVLGNGFSRVSIDPKGMLDLPSVRGSMHFAVAYK